MSIETKWEKTPIYNVSYRCGKCGHEWSEEERTSYVIQDLNGHNSYYSGILCVRNKCKSCHSSEEVWFVSAELVEAGIEKRMIYQHAPPEVREKTGVMGRVGYEEDLKEWPGESE